MNQLALFEPQDTSLRGYLATLGRVAPARFKGAKFAVLPPEGEWMYCEEASVAGVFAAGFDGLVLLLTPAPYSRQPALPSCLPAA